MSRNAEVAALLYEISEILELQGVAFKPRAYQRAAQNIEALGEDVEVLAREKRLGDVPGVGRAITEKITEYLGAGRLKYLEELRKEIPEGVLAMMRVPGMGPKKALRLYAALKIKSIEELKAAAAAGKIRDVEGFGVKSEAEILKSLERQAALPARFPSIAGLEAAGEILSALRATGNVLEASYAGSLRRGRDYIGDVDLLAVAKKGGAAGLMEAFTTFRRVKDVLAKGATKSSVRLDNGLQSDLRVVEPKAFGAALLYFTGSKDHNIAVRAIAQKKGLTLNEYGLAKVKRGAVVASRTEEEIYGKLGLAWIPPELRENRGEIELAGERKLPKLIELDELTADLHTHTSESDGYAGPEAMLNEASRLGYTTYGFSDHSAGLGIARGLDGPRFAKQRKVLDGLRDGFKEVTILQGSEVNIRKDGTLDLTAKVRAGLDYVVGSVHSAFTLPKAEQTARVVRAIEGGIDILGHPTGRLLGERPSLDIDFEKVATAAAESDVLLEINGSPFRLDLPGELVRTAREIGASFAIDSDAHTVEGLAPITHGVTQARRGALSAADVVTTRKPGEILKWLGHAKKG